eukprot:8797203-Lingulodinium_polyedra.AAC.1
MAIVRRRGVVPSLPGSRKRGWGCQQGLGQAMFSAGKWLPSSQGTPKPCFLQECHRVDTEHTASQAQEG